MTLTFTKMHGLGNDFMVVDGITQSFQPSASLIQQWSNRHTGIGFDQLLFVEKSKNKNADFLYRIFNADGSEVAQCGNGARCLMKFLNEKKLTNKSILHVETQAGLLELRLENNGEITVNMGVPLFIERAACTLELKNKTSLNCQALSIGNPHCVLTIEDIKNAPVDTLGQEISHHLHFPDQANVDFMQIIDKRNIALRVYERGVGETQACGSGACAAVIAGRLQEKLDEHVTVHQPGGDLKIAWHGPGNPVFLTGPAVTVCEGTIEVTK